MRTGDDHSAQAGTDPEQCIGSDEVQQELERLHQAYTVCGTSLSSAALKILSFVNCVGRWKTDDLSCMLQTIFDIPSVKDVFVEDCHQNMVIVWPRWSPNASALRSDDFDHDYDLCCRA